MRARPKISFLIRTHIYYFPRILLYLIITNAGAPENIIFNPHTHLLFPTHIIIFNNDKCGRARKYRF